MAIEQLAERFPVGLTRVTPRHDPLPPVMRSGCDTNVAVSGVLQQRAVDKASQLHSLAGRCPPERTRTLGIRLSMRRKPSSPVIALTAGAGSWRAIAMAT